MSASRHIEVIEGVGQAVPGGGFERNIFREKTVPAVIDYIHANPVRRGLIEHPTDWQWSSARFWDRWPNVPIRMDDPFA